MRRSVLAVICAVSGIVFLVLCVIIVNGAIEAMNAPAAGIIGGAGLPTLEFLLGQLLRSPVGIAAGTALAVFCGSGLTLLRGEKKP